MANFNYVSQVGSNDFSFSGAGTGSGAPFTGSVYSYGGNQTVTYTAGATGTLTYSLSIYDMMYAGATAYVQVNGSTIGGTMSVSGTSSYTGTVSVTSGQTVYFFFNPGTDTSHMSYLTVGSMYITAAPTVNVIKPNRSYTTTNTPAYTNAGELSCNVTDGKIWITNAAASALVLVSSLARSDHTGTLAVASGGTGVTTSTGSSNNVLSTSPLLVTPTFTAPILGTPSSGTLTSCTGLPISTGVSGLATGAATFLATPTSANLIALMTDETGTGANVFATSPTLVTPLLGTPTSGTLTSCTGLPISSGVSGLGTSVAAFLATPSSANLASCLTDETGSGLAVFATSPAITTPTITGLNETKTAPTIASGVLALNCASGNVFHVSLNAAITSITFSNIPTGAYGLTLAFTMDGTARSVTWGSAIKWASGGTAPTLTSTLNKVDIFCLTTWDSGTTWFSMVGGQNF